MRTEEKKNREKSADSRLSDAEKQKAETMRSISVAQAKIAHSLIKEIEKMRIREDVSSLNSRILTHIRAIANFYDFLVKVSGDFGFKQARDIAKNIIETYYSIREDLKSVTKMNDDKLSKLFPERSMDFESSHDLDMVLQRIIEQESQIVAFLERY